MTTIPLFRLALITVLALVHQSLYSQDFNNLKLKDYRPVSIYKIPITEVPKAKYPAIDMHSHDYAKAAGGIDAWVKLMDEVGVEKSVILSYATGAKFDSIVARYAPYGNRFEIWCGFDYTGFDQPGWQEHAVQELERCFKKGAKGVGELGDKGLGEFYSTPVPAYGMHLDDPRMKPLLEKCGQLKMPINVHVAEDEWMYLNADSTNDGLMNAGKWKVDLTKKGILNHDQLIATLENAVKNNPKTTFIACHLANSCANLNVLGRLFDSYSNLFADIAARYGEVAPIPRFAHNFIEKYQDRIVYGTDMSINRDMYSTTFRILETSDEHFYKQSLFSYHWPLYGLYLGNKTLKKLYSENARKIMKR